jgi:hypothetical protein
MATARQRLGKYVPEVTLSTIEERPLLGNKHVPWTETELTRVYTATNKDRIMWIVEDGDLYSVLPRVVKAGRVIDSALSDSFVKEFRVR